VNGFIDEGGRPPVSARTPTGPEASWIAVA
jgi:hypothetical protein